VQQADALEDRALFDERMTRLQGDIDSLRLEVGDLRGDLHAAQANANSASLSQVADLRASQSTLQQRLDTLEALREQDKKELIDKVTASIKSLIGTQGSSGAPRMPATPGGSEYGFEHEVAQGENLSSIARAYGVSMKRIIEANGLPNADDLRIGQKLFIPD
jgi:LysM repeat protein